MKATGIVIQTPCYITAQIADIIDSEVSLVFNKIPFRELVRDASGDLSDIVAELLNRASNICNKLSLRFHELYQPTGIYKLVIEVSLVRTLYIINSTNKLDRSCVHPWGVGLSL
jgi:hypothetical protein